MTAKELFEKLGYEQKIGVDFILYVLDSKETKDLQYYIEFHTDVKTIIIDTNKKDFINDINIKEFQAINQQVKELGWDVLNDEVEILADEEEFEDIEECKRHYLNTYGRISQCRKSEEHIINSINQLIRNQKKIIERLEKNE